MCECVLNDSIRAGVMKRRGRVKKTIFLQWLVGGWVDLLIGRRCTVLLISEYEYHQLTTLEVNE